MTEEMEERLCESGYFKSQGYHFKPLRQFTEKDGDFYDITRRLKRDVELGMMEADYAGKQKHLYSYKGFYAASPDKEADIFLCLENQKEYIPCQHELQEYMPELEKKHRRGKTR